MFHCAINESSGQKTLAVVVRIRRGCSLYFVVNNASPGVVFVHVFASRSSLLTRAYFRNMDIASMIDQSAQLMTQYAGRDKSLRSLYFTLILYSTKLRQRRAQLVMAFAKQMSQTRLVLRQFNHFGMLQACRSAYNAYLNGPADRVDHALISSITGIYTVYGVVELLAWLADAKLIAMDAGRLFKYCLYMWIAALVCGIVKSARLIYKKGLEKSKADQLTLAALGSDFVSAINSLPFKFLWSGKLTTRQSASFSLIASVIGLYKLF
ncbi:hypothetical protein L596_009566 [Steinernema carpocapsae]|uniref:Uncharacterized protein n=1 Tax=Steinernema carpocapsae TaxID=34508 RepID=A0A4U5PGI5_STECR|nr:hypothetical protein L596_009566 [Steinernema carpocapsae]